MITTLRKNISHMFFLTIIFFVSGFIVSLVYMSIHEQVHAAIFRSYEIPSESRIYLFSATTEPLNRSLYDINCDSYCHLANNETDVVGYHAALIIFSLFAVFYIREIYKLGITEIKKENKRDVKEKESMVDKI